MPQRNWSEFTAAFATYARSKLATNERGTLLIRCTGDGTMLAAVYGNDNYRASTRARQEAHLVRQRLREMSASELGFALSPDGYTWAVLVQARQQPYQTPAGKLFQMEMLKEALEDTVQVAWQTAGNGTAAR
jgi:hypothetical protein